MRGPLPPGLAQSQYFPAQRLERLRPDLLIGKVARILRQWRKWKALGVIDGAKAWKLLLLEEEEMRRREGEKEERRRGTPHRYGSGEEGLLRKPLCLFLPTLANHCALRLKVVGRYYGDCMKESPEEESRRKGLQQTRKFQHVSCSQPLVFEKNTPWRALGHRGRAR